MNVSINFDLLIKAEPIDEHYGLKKDRYDVRSISMGQSSTHIKIMGCGDRSFNSIHFKFYLHNREIDIYNSGLINNYRTINLPGINFKE